MAQGDGTIGGQDAFLLGPEEVAGLIACQLASLGSMGILVPLNVEGIVGDIAELGIEGVVAVGINGRQLIFPVQLVAAAPLAGALIVCEENVIGMVTSGLQLHWLPVLVVHDENTYLIAVGKAAVAGARGILLVNLGP